MYRSRAEVRSEETAVSSSLLLGSIYIYGSAAKTMSQMIQTAIVRIKTADNVIVGAGFLATENHILTCAHVVSDALGQPRQEMPGAPVLLDFPFIAPGEKVTAVVTLWRPKRPDGTGDIAGLELQAPPPVGARPLRLVNTLDTWNHPFRAFRFSHPAR
ncbi:MAG: hypothetical protein R3E31_19420 [Chloroflexota bacterium]